MKTKNFRSLTRAILLFALLMTLISSSFAGDKIKIRLHQPPPNKLSSSDLWKLDITNSTRESIKIYLTGTASEQKSGLIVTGKSKVITVSPGTKTYTYEDFKSGEVNWKNKSVQESVVRTGSVPEGEYTICVTAFFENNEIADQESCIEQTVKQQGSINLISPEDGKELDPDTLPGLVFMWTPAAGDNGPYSLRIVELKGDQSPDVAIKENRPILDKEGIKSTNYQYSPADAKLEKGKKYAWMISSGSTSSEVWVLSMMGTCTSLQVDSIKIKCTENPKVFSYQFYTKNVCTSIVKWTGLTINPSIPGATISTTPAAPQNINGLAQLLITGTLTFTSTLPNSVCLRLESTSPSGSGYSRIDTCLSLPNCSKNCCEGFIRKVDLRASPVQILQHGTLTGNGMYNINTSITAGPNKITKVSAELVYANLVPNDPNCLKCVYSSSQFGNFQVLSGGRLPNSTLGGLQPVMTTQAPFTDYSHEVIWQDNSNNGVVLNNERMRLLMRFPPQFTLPCCDGKISFCIRFSFTDDKCQTCDTLICMTIRHKLVLNPGHLPENPKFKLSPEQRFGPDENGYEEELKEIEEDIYRKEDGEGQGSIKEVSQIAEDSLKIHPMERWETYSIEEVKKLANEYNISGEDRQEFIDNSRQMFDHYQELKMSPEKRYLTGALLSSDGCDNGGFESGFTNWAGAKGSNNSVTGGLGGINTNSSFIAQTLPYTSGTNSITLVGPGTDALTSISTVHSGSSAVKIGNTTPSYGCDLLSKTFTVTSSTSNLVFWYAVVFQNPGHVYNDQPFFVVRVKNSGGSIVSGLTPAGFPLVSQITNPFFQQLSGGSILYKNWECAKLDLSSLVGQTVTVEFIAADCSQGGHYGYVYLDDLCSTCSNNPTGNCTLNLVSSTCNNLPIQVCGNFTLPTPPSPWTTSLQSLTMNIYRNGVQVGTTLTSPVITGTNFCFTLNASDFPATPPDGFDFVATAVFSLVNGSTTTTITQSSSTPGNGVKPGQNNDYFVICPESPCCKDFKKDVRGSIEAGNDGSYTLSGSLIAGPNKIKRVSATVEYFSMQASYPDCEKCVKNSIDWGNLMLDGANSGIAGLSGPTLTGGGNFSREVVWGSISGPAINMLGGVNIKLKLKLPAPFSLSCCADTFKICIRFKFTDEKCVTCDKLICFKIVQKPKAIRTTGEEKSQIEGDEKLQTGGLQDTYDIISSEVTSEVVKSSQGDCGCNKK